MLYYLGNRDASVAQSVEQLIRNQQVVCSSHITSSKAPCGLDRRAFLRSMLDAVIGAQYNK